MSSVLRGLVGLTALAIATPVAAQLNTAPATPLTAPEETPAPAEDYRADEPQSGYGPPPPIDKCDADQEAAQLSGEIVVCRRVREQEEFRLRTRKGSQADYARRTAFAGDPQAPDVAGAGIFRGPATVSGLCLLPPCPAAAMPDIDHSAIPEAPPGSDADRIARGLPPLGRDGARTGEAAQGDTSDTVSPDPTP